MAELKEDYRKEERINGIVYDMSPLQTIAMEL